MTSDSPPWLRQRRTKILATLSAQGTTEDAIATQLEAGAEIFRLPYQDGEEAARIAALLASKATFVLELDEAHLDAPREIEALNLGPCFLALPFTTAEKIRRFRGELRKPKTTGLIGRVDSGAPPEAAEPILAVCDAVFIDAVGEPPTDRRDAVVEACRRHQTPVFISVAVDEIARTIPSGVDAVALPQAESASVRIVAANETIRTAEAKLFSECAFRSLTDLDAAKRPLPLGDAIGRATACLSRDLRARTVLVITRTGLSARILSASRPAAPVIAATSNARVGAFLRVCWGVTPVVVRKGDIETPVPLLRRVVRDQQLAEPGQYALIVSGFHQGTEDSRPSVTAVMI